MSRAQLVRCVYQNDVKTLSTLKLQWSEELSTVKQLFDLAVTKYNLEMINYFLQHINLEVYLFDDLLHMAIKNHNLDLIFDRENVY